MITIGIHGMTDAKFERSHDHGLTLIKNGKIVTNMEI